MSQGHLYEIQPDSSYTEYKVKYDYENDKKNGIVRRSK